MNVLGEIPGDHVQRSTRRRGGGSGGALLSLVAAAVLVSACGSGDEGSLSDATAVVASAQENAVVAGPVCYGWPNGTTDAQPCAVGLKGPGGGRVFYDAGSEQPWGRFLEVAPQAWNGTLVACNRLRLSCGSVKGVAKKTSDVVAVNTGYFPCRTDNTAVLLPGEAGDTLWEIGGGRRNTEVLSNTAECVDGTTSALTLATGYRGGGLSDWYLPSDGELTELCRYTGRNAIGGFANWVYVSSTVKPKPQENISTFYGYDFASDPLCAQSDTAYLFSGGGRGGYFHHTVAVRPIRAFS